MTGSSRPALGTTQPAEKAVGRGFGDPALARGTVFQMFAHRIGRDIIELAEAIRLQCFVGRVDGGGGAHNLISVSRVSSYPWSINH